MGGGLVDKLVSNGRIRKFSLGEVQLISQKKKWLYKKEAQKLNRTHNTSQAILRGN